MVGAGTRQSPRESEEQDEQDHREMATILSTKARRETEEMIIVFS
jgi:hypothetical protein